VRRDLDDQVGVERCGDAFKQWNGRNDATRLKPGQHWLTPANPASQFGLRETQGQAALAHGSPYWEGTLRFRVSLLVSGPCLSLS